MLVGIALCLCNFISLVCTEAKVSGFYPHSEMQEKKNKVNVAIWLLRAERNTLFLSSHLTRERADKVSSHI